MFSGNELRKAANEILNREKISKKQVILLKQDWLEQTKQSQGKCSKCPRIDGLTLDHIIPKDLLSQFGIDDDKEYIPENYELLCSQCNQFKGKRLDFTNPRTKFLLLEFLDRI